jgi:hypothetical protein
MKKEQVIIFEGEHNFVMKKNHVRDKKTGISHYVADEMNVIAPVGVGVLDAPIEPPTQTDGPAPSPTTTTTLQDASQVITSVPKDVVLLGGGLSTTPVPDLLPLGNKPNVLSDEEMTTSTTSSTTTKIVLKIDIPTGLGTNPTLGGIGGGGGKKETPAEAKKSFLQKYWWILLLVGGGGAYYYYKKKNK